MDTAPITNIFLYVYFSASHGIAQDIPCITMHYNFSRIHGISDTILTITKNFNGRTVHESSKVISRCSIYIYQGVAFQAVANISMAHSIFYGDFAAITAAI